jgi:hypothetical protein
VRNRWGHSLKRRKIEWDCCLARCEVVGLQTKATAEEEGSENGPRHAVSAHFPMCYSRPHCCYCCAAPALINVTNQRPTAALCTGLTRNLRPAFFISPPPSARPWPWPLALAPGRPPPPPSERAPDAAPAPAHPGHPRPETRATRRTEPTPAEALLEHLPLLVPSL